MKESNQQVPPFRQASLPQGVPSQSLTFRPFSIFSLFRGICIELTEKWRTHPLYGTGSFETDNRGRVETSGRPPNNRFHSHINIICLKLYKPIKIVSLDMLIPFSVLKTPELNTLSTDKYTFLPNMPN
jgi:hypothetical protein